MENPQPEPLAPDAGAPIDAQPAEPVEPAEQNPTEPPVTPTSDEPAPEDPADNSDEDASSYWSKLGIDISTPEGQAQAAKSYRESVKKMHEATQQASELERSVNGQPLAEATTDPAVQEALERSARVETALTVERWKASKGITPEQDKALGQYLVDNPQKAWLVKNGHLNLDDVYAMSGVGAKDPAVLKKEGGREALESLANKQRTTVPSGNAASQAAPAAKDPLLAVLED